VIPDAEIAYIGWLTKESTLKRISSIVVEFKDLGIANAIIYTGMAWDGYIHQYQLYDRAYRVKQCFRCYNYGHIGTQCNASQICGHCTEQHETRNCRQRGAEGFTPRCAVCKGAHTAWSNACPARKKELGRVQQAKEVRSIYWHVPFKENIARPRIHSTRNANANQEVQILTNPIPAQTTAQLDGVTQSTTARANASTHIEPQAPLVTSQPINQLTTRTLLQAQSPTLTEETIMPASAAPSFGEDGATPAIPPVSTQQLDIPVDPQIQAEDESFSSTRVPETEQQQQSEYPLDNIGGAFAIQDTDTWLDSLANDIDGWWIDNIAEDSPSPPSSMATDPRTALGGIYKGCKCPPHQDIYSNWPTHDAELVIARCMKICMYCGKDFESAAKIRRHLKKYSGRNLTVRQEKSGLAAVTPAWTPHTHPPDARMTRSQSATNGTSVIPHS
jgi:hypothetical protein